MLSLFLLAVGCESSSRSAPAGAEQTTATARDCELLQQRVCAEAGDTSPVCKASALTLQVLGYESCAMNLREFAAVQDKLKVRRAPCSQLIQEVCTSPEASPVICDSVKQQTAALVAEDCSKLLPQKDALVTELKREEIAKNPLDEANQARIAGGDAPSFGPSDAPVTVVVFSDFQCPFCARTARLIEPLKERFGEQLRVVFRQFPLPSHQQADAAAQAALAAHAQGKFWPYHDRLFEHQNQLDYASLLQHAKAVGLDVGAFKRALDEAEYSSAVLAERLMGAELGVDATPTLFVNGRRVRDGGDLAAVASEVEAALGGS